MNGFILPLLAAAAGLAWVLALWRLRLGAHPSVLAWQRLARLRGLDDRRPAGERVAARIPLPREATDLGRLLRVAGRPGGAASWLLQVGALAGLCPAAILAADEVAIAAGQQPPLPPVTGLIAGAAIALLAYTRLRRQAAARQHALGIAVTDSLAPLAMMTFHQRVPIAEALLIFARCQRSPRLLAALAEPAEAGRSTATTYERLGEAYCVPMFVALGSAVCRVTERGLPSQDAFAGLARSAYDARLAAARVATAQSRTLIVIPMGLMIIPVLVLIGAPLVASLAGMFAR